MSFLVNPGTQRGTWELSFTVGSHLVSIILSDLDAVTDMMHDFEKALEIDVVLVEDEKPDVTPKEGTNG